MTTIDKRLGKAFGNYKSREELTEAITVFKETLNITDTAKQVGVSKTTVMRIIKGDAPSYDTSSKSDGFKSYANGGKELMSTVFNKYWTKTLPQKGK